MLIVNSYWECNNSISLWKSTFSWRMSLSYRNQSIDLYSKSTDWFLYGTSVMREVKRSHKFSMFQVSKNLTSWKHQTSNLGKDFFDVIYIIFIPIVLKSRIRTTLHLFTNTARINEWSQFCAFVQTHVYLVVWAITGACCARIIE